MCQLYLIIVKFKLYMFDAKVSSLFSMQKGGLLPIFKSDCNFFIFLVINVFNN